MSVKGIIRRWGIVTDGANLNVPYGTITARNVGGSVGNVWYASSGVTSSGDGKSWDTAVKTIAEAVTLASAGDTIYIYGSFSEAVTCNKANVRILGGGPTPKSAIWTAPTVAGSWCLKITANYVEVANIYFEPVVYTSSGTPSGIYLSGANWAYIHDCRFQGQVGSRVAIYSPVCDSDNVHIARVEFFYMNTATYGQAILGVEADGLSYSGWVIEDCILFSCLLGININGRGCTIEGCIFQEYGISPAGAITQYLTTAIDLSGTSSGCNMVFGNQFPGDYSTARFVPGASGDVWVGNFCDDVEETEVGDNGISIANPAA